MRCDYHVHSEFSDDSRTPLSEQVLKACELGLDEICFTEHVDYGIKEDWDAGNIKFRNGEPLANADYPKYFAELENLRVEFFGKIIIRAGLEFGVQSHTIEKYEKLFARYKNKLDFILLSIHQVNDKEFWTQDFQRGKTQDEYNLEYYNELLKVVKNFHDYSVLAHLDLLVRYDLAGAYPFEKVQDIIAEILKTAIHDGKGIELNTSSWRYKLNDTQPSRKILQLYRDLGGEIITLGSDAHTTEYVAAHMEDGKNILREIGFKKFCTFENLTPVFHAL